MQKLYRVRVSRVLDYAEILEEVVFFNNFCNLSFININSGLFIVGFLETWVAFQMGHLVQNKELSSTKKVWVQLKGKNKDTTDFFATRICLLLTFWNGKNFFYFGRFSLSFFFMPSSFLLYYSRCLRFTAFNRLCSSDNSFTTPFSTSFHYDPSKYQNFSPRFFFRAPSQGPVLFHQRIRSLN